MLPCHYILSLCFCFLIVNDGLLAITEDNRMQNHNAKTVLGDFKNGRSYSKQREAKNIPSNIISSESQSADGQDESFQGNKAANCKMSTRTKVFSAMSEADFVNRDYKCKINNQSIVISAQNTISFINTFKDNYTQELLGEPWDLSNKYINDTEKDYLWLEICGRENDCMKVLPQLPHQKSPPNTLEELEKLLVQVLGYSQRYSTALENLILHQTLTENKFLREISETKDNMDEVTREFMASINSCCLQPNEQLIKSLTDKEYVVVRKETEALRGFRTLR
ncbi:uncharacterized protein LOC135210337 [Macrobrachium nipponense]|uniref:uncharacterized protein LOC135210337 n=1 Tax=Macrobrachium nipponense TaxID=159736 RepID=UPI0030C83840